MSDTPKSTVDGIFLGTARTIITSEPGCELSGFIARVEPMAGVHDELQANAMVWAEDAELKNVAGLVTLDVIELDADSIAKIRARITMLTGIAGERIGVTCTHTHGGPATMPGRRLGNADVDYLDRLCQLAAETVAEAANAISPAIVTWGVGNEPTVGKNRRIPGGIIDPDVAVIRFQRADGTVAGLLVSYGCHPVTLGPNNVLATADYPGYVRRTMEAVYPGAAVQFATGCCGQVNNGHTSRDGDKGRGMTWRTFGEAERIGRAVAGAAIQTAERSARLEAAMPVTDVPVVPMPIRTARRMIPLPFLPPPSPEEVQRLREEWQAELRDVERRDSLPGEIDRLLVFLAWADELLAGSQDASIDAEVMTIALGDIALVLLPGESFVEFGLEIKQRGTSPRIMTLAYANGRPGYIPHRSAYPAGGYEIEEAYRYYGYPACFAPEAGELIVETAVELLALLE
jgi:neutral ceramidase